MSRTKKRDADTSHDVAERVGRAPRDGGAVALVAPLPLSGPGIAWVTPLY